MDYEQEWKGVAIQTNGDDNYAAASVIPPESSRGFK